MMSAVFESSVNSEGIETRKHHFIAERWFESSVNSEGIETIESICNSSLGLRAV